MKNFIKITVISIFAITHSLSMANFDTTIFPLDEAIKQYHKNLLQTNKSISQLLEVSKKFMIGEESVEKLKMEYLQTRLHFKKVEFLLEYFSHNQVKAHLNGPTTNELIFGEIYQNHEGLQAIDKLIFGSHPSIHASIIHEKLKLFKEVFKKVSEDHLKYSISNSNIFEATRDQLIRMFAQGISGYDTPKSNNEYAEAISTIESLEESLNPYLKMAGAKREPLAYEITYLFKLAKHGLIYSQQYQPLNNQFFLRKCVHPLYKKIYQLQYKLGYLIIESPA